MRRARAQPVFLTNEDEQCQFEKSMSAKAKQRRKTIREKARNAVSPECSLAAWKRRWEREKAEELRIRKAVEEGTATDEERKNYEVKRKEEERWDRLYEDLRDSNLMIETHSYKRVRQIADMYLLKKLMMKWLIESVPLHRVDIECRGDWNYDVYVYFLTEDELAASDSGGWRAEIERGLRGEILKTEDAPPEVAVRFFYGSHEFVTRDCEGSYDRHSYLCRYGSGSTRIKKMRGPGRWSDG